MYKVLVATEAPLSADDLRQDLQDIGIDVVAENIDATLLAAAVVRSEPDLVIAASPSPSPEMFEAARMLGTLAPRPFVTFTSDSDAAKIEKASVSNIHSYVVNGYAKHRLLSIMEVARARFRNEQVLKDELTGLSKRFEERKIVDRAKGALMRSRGVSEEEAFEILRNLAMNARQRIGVASQSVVDMSRAGEVVNRSGQLRMLSQRIVRSYAQSIVGPEAEGARQITADCVARVEANLGILRKAISTKGYGDLVGRVTTSWKDLHAMATDTPVASRVEELDSCAESMLKDAETLTDFLESSGLAPSLRILNIAGRQRMLSQRICKFCFLLAIEPQPARAAQLSRLVEAFQKAMDFLFGAPLTSPPIKTALDNARVEWKNLGQLLGAISEASALSQISEVSDRLLGIFEHLTDQYEQALQVLIGDRMGRMV
jgi:AmiR/NasT family two-component response regulator